PIYSVLAQQIGPGQEPLSRIEDMAALAVSRLRSVQPRGPYGLVGHSMGGLVAFEAAQQLVAAGESVSELVLIDTSARPGARHMLGSRLRRALSSSPSENAAAIGRARRRSRGRST